MYLFIFFFQAEDGIRDLTVTGVQTCALPISRRPSEEPGRSRERDRLYAHPGSWPDRMSRLSGEKKRTGFGSHPGGRKAKPDAGWMQVGQGEFLLGSREMRAASRLTNEKAERVWFAPW